jgi:hypothetical protein
MDRVFVEGPVVLSVITENAHTKRIQIVSFVSQFFSFEV